MARLARLVIPGLAHHITQRGNGRARTFFGDDDYELYRDLLAEHCRAAGVGVWAWCLMPNHVHLILVPSDADGLRRALSGVHRHYAGIIHARRRRAGHFWQGRFGAAVMDEDHLAAALRYVSLNPVRARLVAPSPARGTGAGRAPARISAARAMGSRHEHPCAGASPRLAELLTLEPGIDLYACLRAAESIGRPLGDDRFLARIERLTGLSLKPRKRGPKPVPK